MIRNFITPEEFYNRHPVRQLVDSAALPGILGAAAGVVGEELRSQGNLRTGFQLPIMFESIDLYEPIAFTADTTSTSAASKESSRLVADCTVAPEGTTYVTLEGCYDATPDGDTIWFPIVDLQGDAVIIDVLAVELKSCPFITSAVTYRYKVFTTDTVTMRVYLVDGSIDELIRYKALEIALEPLIDGSNERIWNYYQLARERYSETLQKLHAAYDSDEDGTIDTDETNTRNITRMRR